MNTVALLLIVIGTQATTIEVASMQQCATLQQFAEAKLKESLSKKEYITQCFVKMGGPNHGS